MKKVILYILLFINGLSFAQITGVVSSEEGVLLKNVSVYNTSKQIKVSTDANGRFSIDAAPEHTLCFLADNYDKFCTKIGNENNLNISLIRTTKQIKEVVIYSKDFKKMVQSIKINDSKETVTNLNQSLQLPRAIEKPKVAPTVTKDILLPLLTANIKVEEFVEIVSGQAKKNARLYEYERFEQKVNWIKERIEPNFFTEGGIKENEIVPFIEFFVRQSTKVISNIKANNIEAIKFEMLGYFELYIGG